MVLFDSYFGNTELIARAVMRGLSTHHQTEAMRLKDLGVSLPEGVDILVVGSPTRAFRPSPEMQAFLRKIPSERASRLHVASFDTRIRPENVKSGFVRFMMKCFGYAARPMLKTLEQKGAKVMAPAAGFAVNNTEGPLADGELERARLWGEQLMPS